MRIADRVQQMGNKLFVMLAHSQSLAEPPGAGCVPIRSRRGITQICVSLCGVPGDVGGHIFCLVALRQGAVKDSMPTES
jgi:hypothetical protein